MNKFGVYLFGALFSVVGVTPALSGPAYDSLKRVLEDQGLQNVSAASVEDVDGSLKVTKLTADQDGYKIQINELTATSPKANDWGFAADRLVFSGASRTGDGMVVGFGKLNLDRVELPYSTSDRRLVLSTAIMADAIVMDDAMNALSLDRFILSRTEGGKVIDLGYQGHVSGQVLSALVPWAVTPVVEERVPFQGSMKLDAGSGVAASLSTFLKLDGFGDYQLKFALSGFPSDALTQPQSLVSSYGDAKLEKFELTLGNMEWLGEALAKHTEEERSAFIEFVSKLSGGIIAQLGTIDDGLLLKNSVEAFMKAPSRLVISAAPGLRIKDLSGKREPQSLNLNIVESLSAGGRKDQASDSAVE